MVEHSRKWEAPGVRLASRPSRAGASAPRCTIVAILVLSGIPAAGKSDYARYLVREHRYYYVSLNGEDETKMTDDLQREARGHYGAALESGDVAQLVATLQAPHEPVVVEWGFPPNQLTLAVARGLREAGA